MRWCLAMALVLISCSGAATPQPSVSAPTGAGSDADEPPARTGIAAMVETAVRTMTFKVVYQITKDPAPYRQNKQEVWVFQGARSRYDEPGFTTEVGLETWTYLQLDKGAYLCTWAGQNPPACRRQGPPKLAEAFLAKWAPVTEPSKTDTRTVAGQQVACYKESGAIEGTYCFTSTWVPLVVERSVGGGPTMAVTAVSFSTQVGDADFAPPATLP